MKLGLQCIILFTILMGIHAENHQKICTEHQTEPECEKRHGGEKITCRGGFQTLSAKEHTKAKTLNLCQWADTSFSPYDFSEKFPKIKNLGINGGDLKYLLEDFPMMPLEKVNLSNLPLDYLQSSAFSNLRNLKTLDLSNNKFEDLDPAIVYNLPETAKIYLSGNPWNCTSSLFWILDPVIQEKVADLHKMHCGQPYTGKPVVSALKFLQKMEDECPIACKCTMSHLIWNLEQTFLHPVIEVDCSLTGLTVMPDYLPSNTTTLYLNGNSISDISPLVNSPVYNKVSDIYLDSNRISSINILEGSEWLKHFRVFSLKQNLVKKVPVYALDHGFESNRNLGKMYLGGNPWVCDCDFIPSFQLFLIKYQAVVRDSQDIKCRENSSELSLMPVLEIPLTAVCFQEETGINPLDVISGVLALLIVLVIGKLLYDYWTFKRTGKLPWIVAKMP